MNLTSLPTSVFVLPGCKIVSFVLDETRRIIAAGGWVEFNRVNGEYRWISVSNLPLQFESILG